jgi:hypothetical protein
MTQHFFIYPHLILMVLYYSLTITNSLRSSRSLAPACPKWVTCLLLIPACFPSYLNECDLPHLQPFRPWQYPPPSFKVLWEPSLKAPAFEGRYRGTHRWLAVHRCLWMAPKSSDLIPSNGWGTVTDSYTCGKHPPAPPEIPNRPPLPLGVVLATVPDRHFGSGFGSKPNRWQIGSPGRQ